MIPENRTLEEFISVPYGSKMLGGNNFIFIVPHSENHEKEAKEIVALVAMKTASYALINTKMSRRIVDLNNVEGILQSQNKVAFEFYNDALTMISFLMLKNRGRQVNVVFVHCSPRIYKERRRTYQLDGTGTLMIEDAGSPRRYDIDLGCGLTEADSPEDDLESRYPLASKVRPRLSNSGQMTCTREFVHGLKSFFQKKGLKATVGWEWPALKKYNFVQKCRALFPDVQVFQVEFIPDKKELVQKALIQMVEDNR